MKNSITIIILFITVNSCYKDELEDFKIDALPENRASMQQRIVGQLAGEFELSEGIKLSSRWTPNERALSRQYFKVIINQLGLQPLEQNYRQANLNFAVDLLIEPFKGTNIYTILPATVKSNNYIVLGAHYDTGVRNAPGAIDNATGVTLIYSVTKALQKIAHREQHIIMVFFDQEEEENVGSNEFVKLIEKKNWNITSVHCFDMIGWDSNNDDAIGIYTASKSLENTYLTIAKKMNKKIFNIAINPVGYANNSTDFDEFVRGGYNVVGAGECYYQGDTTPFKDTEEDAYDTVNFDYLLSSTKFIETVIKNLLY